MKGFVSPRLGIRFEPGEGPDSLRIFRPDGVLFRTASEWIQKSANEQRVAEAERRRAEAEHRRAEAEHQHAAEQSRVAEAERQRAEAERQRAERLAARLRELGIDPE